MNSNYSYLCKNPPVCPYCGKQMVLDDVAVAFKGNQDEYWMCESPNCSAHLYVKVRYGKVCKKESYHGEQ